MAPLARFIELTEVDLVCVDSAPARYATTGLVMCGRGYESQPWLKKALRSSNSVIAVLLADVDPGVKNTRSVDLRSWPGRSADRTVLALAEWMKSDGKSSFPGMRAKPATSASNPQRSQNIAAFMVLAVIVGLFYMMAQSTDRKSEALTPMSKPPPTVSVSSTTATASSTTAPMSSSTTSGSATTAPVQSTDSGSISSAQGSPAGSAPDTHRPEPVHSSKQTIAAVSNPAHSTVSMLPGTRRAELDQCYLLRRADGDVPSRTCLISNTVRRLNSQSPEDLL